MPTETSLRRIVPWLAGVIIVLYYVFFTWRSAVLYFDQDDMMNLYFAWVQPVKDLALNHVLYWRDPLRPLGAAWYRTMFAIAGFNPLPFRVVFLAIGLMNLGLCAWFVRLISGSWMVAAFAALLFAFHTRLVELWFRTATIYDALCFLFFYLAACLYIEGHRVAVVLCFVAALDAKEVAIALPVTLLAWEALLAPQRQWRRLLLPVVLGLIALPYLWAKTLGPKALAANPYYTPEYSWTRFSETWGTFLGYIFVQPGDMTGWRIWAILGGMLVVAVLIRSRAAVFAWILIMVATLPMSFVPRRGGFALYVAYAGWAMFGALLIERLIPERRALTVASLLFILVGWRVGKIHLRDQRPDLDAREWLYGSPRVVQRFANDLDTLYPALPKGARILLLNDGFATDEYTALFVVRLKYRDATITLDRVKTTPSADRGTYQYILDYRNSHYVALRS